MNENQTTIQLAGREATLTADNRAKFRFQSVDGRLSGLLDADHSYLHSVRLVHSMADDATRVRFPLAEDLAEVIPDEGEAAQEAFLAVFTLARDAGWFLTAEELIANIAQAKADLVDGAPTSSAGASRTASEQ